MSETAQLADQSVRPRVGGAILFTMALVALLVAWMPAGYSMVDRWMGSYGYYSHGLLVPLIALYLIWLRRDALKQAPIRRSRWGLLVMGVGLLGQVVSAYAQIAFTSGFSMWLILIGLVWYVYGTAVFRILAFPLCFLAFMIPLSLEMLQQASFPMKMRAAAASTRALRDLFRVPCDLVGSTIKLAGDDQLEVGDPCSGLRSLIALMALGALVAYMARIRLWKRVLLFLCSIPFALAANVVRITVLALIASRWGPEATTGDVVHFGTGFLVFFVAVLLLLGLLRVLRIGTPAPPKQHAPPWSEPLRRMAQILIVLAAVKVLATMFALEEVSKKYLTNEHVATVHGISTTDLSEAQRAEVEKDLDERRGDLRSQTRVQRSVRGTIDVYYLLFTLVGAVLLARGLPWARRYLMVLAMAGIAADVGFAAWLLWGERIPVPAASAGLTPLVVSLHLVLYAGLSAISLLWTFGRLSDARMRAALQNDAPGEGRAPKFARRATAGLVLMVAVAALTWWLHRPASVEAGLIRARNVPGQIGPWTVIADREPEQHVVDVLQTRDILSRVYARAGRRFPVELSIVFSQHQRRATHPPEICFSGAGWETAQRSRVTLDLQRAPDQPRTRFVKLISKRTTKGGPTLLISYYAFKAGPHYTNSYLDQQWKIVRMNAWGSQARGALIRFSVECPERVSPADRKAAKESLLDFMRHALPLVEDALEGRIQGVAAT